MVHFNSVMYTMCKMIKVPGQCMEKGHEESWEMRKKTALKC